MLSIKTVLTSIATPTRATARFLYEIFININYKRSLINPFDISDYFNQVLKAYSHFAIKMKKPILKNFREGF